MNIVFFMSDSFRYDNLSCYGTPRARTPRLDKFSAQANVFNNAYLGSFPTVPNRLDLLTGCFSFTKHEWSPLPADAITLPQLLTASGFVTQLMADTPHLMGAGFNYCRDFSGWEWLRGQETDAWKTAPKDVKWPADEKKIRNPNFAKRYLRNSAWWKSEEDRFTPRTVKAACDWLEQNQDQDQFLLWVDTFDPHEPWDPPRHYVEMYDPDYFGDEIIYPVYGYWKKFATEREVQHMYALYRAEATMVDHWFGVLLDKLDELGMAEDTAVIFASDHGFLFGEHGLVGKSVIQEIDGSMVYEAARLYDPIRRTPLMIRLPGQTQRKTIPALVQAPDLMPTMLEMAGLVTTETISGSEKIQALQCGVFDTKDWQFKPDAIHGKSLMPLLRDETTRLRDLVVCSNTLIRHTPVMAKSAIVTEDGWCLHYSGNYAKPTSEGKLARAKLLNPDLACVPITPALYHLPTDPGEEKDVLKENQALAGEIHRRYVNWLEQVGTPAEHIAERRQLM